MSSLEVNGHAPDIQELPRDCSHHKAANYKRNGKDKTHWNIFP